MPLMDELVSLRPIERSDLARLAGLLEDPEVAALAEEGPVVLASLAEWEAWFQERFPMPTEIESE